MRRGALARRGAALVLGFTVAAAAPAQPPPRSGFEFMSPATQALQADDTQNPGMLWALAGADRWRATIGVNGKACAGCHGEAERSMRGVAARYPAFDERERRPFTLTQRINACRERHQGAPAWAAESRSLLELAAHVGLQSRGLALAAPADPRLADDLALGRRLFGQRMGQLDLACADCHDRLAGKRLAGSVIPQAQLNGYPLYRLEWQSLGSFQRRLRGCLHGIRAEPFAHDSREAVAIELYLRERGAGLVIETPAVRP
jgi:sulfur-oxidizing protein SoxA